MAIPMWEAQQHTLYRSFSFRDFSEAFAFMVRVALLAEQHNHHPTWSNTWNKVEVWLSTHDAGNTVTEKDRKLAQAIDKLVDPG
ncbi:4a-hydroxytetrahydrobiopterin dehydratase [Parapedobacter sp. DT-150]|uniref:4a-hydroxytetrahydrobiopterin dehydratase n=1 Tax=Parapedobacter sp. DT-150 TaxID=3396162 RepID=UPI003F1D286A